MSQYFTFIVYSLLSMIRAHNSIDLERFLQLNPQTIILNDPYSCLNNIDVFNSVNDSSVCKIGDGGLINTAAELFRDPLSSRDSWLYEYDGYKFYFNFQTLDIYGSKVKDQYQGLLVSQTQPQDIKIQYFVPDGENGIVYIFTSQEILSLNLKKAIMKIEKSPITSLKILNKAYPMNIDYQKILKALFHERHIYVLTEKSIDIYLAFKSTKFTGEVEPVASMTIHQGSNLIRNLGLKDQTAYIQLKETFLECTTRFLNTTTCKQEKIQPESDPTEQIILSKFTEPAFVLSNRTDNSHQQSSTPQTSSPQTSSPQQTSQANQEKPFISLSDAFGCIKNEDPRTWPSSGHICKTTAPSIMQSTPALFTDPMQGRDTWSFRFNEYTFTVNFKDLQIKGAFTGQGKIKEVTFSQTIPQSTKVQYFVFDKDNGILYIFTSDQIFSMNLFTASRGIEAKLWIKESPISRIFEDQTINYDQIIKGELHNHHVYILTPERLDVYLAYKSPKLIGELELVATFNFMKKDDKPESMGLFEGSLFLKFPKEFLECNLDFIKDTLCDLKVKNNSTQNEPETSSTQSEKSNQSEKQNETTKETSPRNPPNTSTPDESNSENTEVPVTSEKNTQTETEPGVSPLDKTPRAVAIRDPYGCMQDKDATKWPQKRPFCEEGDSSIVKDSPLYFSNPITKKDQWSYQYMGYKFSFNFQNLNIIGSKKDGSNPMPIVSQTQTQTPIQYFVPDEDNHIIYIFTTDEIYSLNLIKAARKIEKKYFPQSNVLSRAYPKQVSNENLIKAVIHQRHIYVVTTKKIDIYLAYKSVENVGELELISTVSTIYSTSRIKNIGLHENELYLQLSDSFYDCRLSFLNFTICAGGNPNVSEWDDSVPDIDKWTDPNIDLDSNDSSGFILIAAVTIGLMIILGFAIKFVAKFLKRRYRPFKDEEPSMETSDERNI